MKTLLKLRLTFAAAIVALLAGCAGITEANLSDDAHAFDADNGTVIHQELPDFVNGGDQEDMIDIRPSSSYDDRP